MPGFDESVFIVVGGGRGIGRAAALALAREGARVVVQDAGVQPDGTGHDESIAQGVVEQICSQGGQALASSLDVTDPAAAQSVVAAAMQTFGRVDGGFYAAGVLRERPLVRAGDADLDMPLDVQARGAFRFARELAKALIDQKRAGSIVLSSSPAGFAGTPGQTGMSAAALAVVGFVRTAATELRRQGVRINAVVPTARTRMTESLPLFRSIRPDSLTPEHVAQVVCHLLSGAADELSGEVVGVAGGRAYALRFSETPGVFLEGPPVSLDELAARFREVLGG